MIEESGTKIVPMSEELRQEVRDASKGVTEENLSQCVKRHCRCVFGTIIKWIEKKG